MGIKNQVVKSTGWNSIATFTNMGLNFLKVVVLTRLLEKSDFGIVAIALMVTGLMSIFSDLGLTIAIIHKQDTTEKQYSSLFWANLSFNIVLYIILLCLTPLVVIFYKEDILAYIVPILGIEIIANSFGKIFQTIRMKEMDFKFISIVSIISSIVGFIVTLIMALLGYGIYSLVVGQIVGVLITQTTFTISGFKEIHITFHFDINEIKSYLTIGSYHLGARVIDYIASKVDVLLIGRFLGMESLGVYNLAKELLQKPFSIIFNVVSNVLTSAFSMIQSDLEKMRLRYCQMAELLSFVFIPVCAIFFVFAEPIVRLIYGVDYLEVATILRALVVFEFVNNIERTAHPVRTALGRTDLSLLWAIVLFVFTIAVVFVVRNQNVVYLAWGLSLVNFITLFAYWYINLKQLINLSLYDFLLVFWKNLIFAILPCIPFVGLLPLVEGEIARLSMILLYGVFYIGLQWCFNKQIFKQLTSIIKS